MGTAPTGHCDVLLTVAFVPPAFAARYGKGGSIVHQLAELLADGSQNVGGAGLINIPDRTRQGKPTYDRGEHKNSPVMAVLGAGEFETFTCQIDEAIDAASEGCLNLHRLSRDL
jgi:hypothetical protein